MAQVKAPPLTRQEIATREFAVSVVTYIERLLFYRTDSSLPETIIRPKRPAQKASVEPPKRGLPPGEGLQPIKFRKEDFARHVENIVRLASIPLNRYAEDLALFLAQEMFHAGHLTKKGDSLVAAIPFSEDKRKQWLAARLIEWTEELGS